LLLSFVLTDIHADPSKTYAAFLSAIETNKPQEVARYIKKDKTLLRRPGVDARLPIHVAAAAGYAECVSVSDRYTTMKGHLQRIH
jgi:hypothetical protein